MISIKKLIALMTDFGYKDPYVGVMKGVIKSINSDVEIVDLTHGITRHSVLEAAVNLLVSAKYFPQGTIFVVVVDPGVGSERRALLVETNNYILIGPDNGCLSLLMERDGVKRVFDVSDSQYRLSKISSTFHGRDVFAPIAAWVSRGVPCEAVSFFIFVRIG
ncbi:MAG: SAM-dependent chlorinase/fluorinase [Desulfurococcaceae archaeon]